VKNGKEIYKDNLFKELENDDIVKYFRIRENGTILERTLKIEKVFKNQNDVWVIKGEFGDVI
jgi:hypothetical protein